MWFTRSDPTHRFALLALLTLLIVSMELKSASSIDMEQTTIPLLRDGVQSDSYTLDYLREIYQAHITFDSTHQFFIVERNSSYIKVDAKGLVTATVENLTDRAFRIPHSPFVIDGQYLYDFTEDSVTRNKFVPSNRFDPILEEGGFELLYNRAEAIAYGEHRQNEFRNTELLLTEDIRTFIKLEGQWSIVFISQDTLDVTYERNTGFTIPAAPQKPERMVLLKDKSKGIYSHANDEVRFHRYKFPEQNLHYASTPSLKTSSFSSEYVSDRMKYTGIPIEQAGHAVHEIKTESDVLRFREISKRGVLSTKVDNQMSLFVLPESMAKRVPISFLEFIPTKNSLTSGSEGLYILRPK